MTDAPDPGACGRRRDAEMIREASAQPNANVERHAPVADPFRQRAAIGHTSTCTCTTERKATMPPQPDTLDLVPDARAVARAIEWLEAIAERDAWSPKLSFGLSLSLDEALTNIVSYAFDDPSSGRRMDLAGDNRQWPSVRSHQDPAAPTGRDAR